MTLDLHSTKVANILSVESCLSSIFQFTSDDEQ